MFVLKNAIKSITRSKGRNILIGVIVFTITVSACVSLSIKNAAKEAEESGLQNLSITANISVDRQKLMENAQNGGSNSNGSRDMRDMMQQFSALSLEEMQIYAASQYVAGFYYSNATSLSASGSLEPVSEQSSGSTNGNSGNMPGGGRGGMAAMGDFTVTGYSSEDAMTDFTSGSSKITKGQVFDVNSDGYNCIISEELATFNKLSVGDTITLSNPGKEKETYKFTITGIYSTSESESSGGGMRFSTATDPANQIYVSYSALEKVAANSKSKATTSTDDNGNETTTALTVQVNGTYRFSDKESYDNFCEDVTAMGLSENYTVSSADIANYESSLIPLKNLSQFANTLLIIVLIVGGVILIVLNLFNIRERKYEVGVLTAIGIQKGKVAMQFVTELLLVTFAAIVIGTAVGAAISVPVSNGLLESQVQTQQTQQSSRQENFGRGGSNSESGGENTPAVPSNGSANGRRGFGTNNVSYLDQINASVNFSVVLQLIGIGLLLTIVSGLVAVVFVLRYEPLQILANRA